jgi:hypothetical protein
MLTEKEMFKNIEGQMKSTNRTDRYFCSFISCRECPLGDCPALINNRPYRHHDGEIGIFQKRKLEEFKDTQKKLEFLQGL